MLSNKINIGNRLVIYIIGVNDPNFIKSNLPTLISMEKNEKDVKGFNRFRLVVFTDKVNEIRQVAHMIFKKLEDEDEKVHLHIINGNEMPIWKIQKKILFGSTDYFCQLKA